MYYSERIQDFQSWLDKTENLFNSQLSALCDGLLVIAGDTNINLMKPEVTNTEKYLDMLNSLNFHTPACATCHLNNAYLNGSN